MAPRSLLDIANTCAVVGVIADGRYLSQPQLDELRKRLRSLAAAR